MTLMGRCMAGLLAFPLAVSGVDSLLTDNLRSQIRSNLFSVEEPRIETGVKLSLLEQDGFSCTEEFRKTATRPDGSAKILVDGSTETLAYGSWKPEKREEAFLLDFQREFRIARITLWSKNTKTQRTGSVEVWYSRDGKKFLPLEKLPHDPTLDPARGTEKRTLLLNKERITARYLRFRCKVAEGKPQQVIGEVAVWGGEIGIKSDKRLPETPSREVVNFRLRPMGPGAVRVEWPDYQPSKAPRVFRIYRSDKKFRSITDPGVVFEGECAGRSFPVYPLQPGEKCFFGVTSVYYDGEYPLVESLAYTSPDPVACDTLGDMLAINHFWGGGGGRRVKMAEEWEFAALDLLAQSPFKTIRWWMTTPHVMQKLYARGIAPTTFSSPSSYLEGEIFGIRLYGAMNEPHLYSLTGKEFVKKIKPIYEAMKKSNPNNLLYAPSVCLDEWPSIRFLEEFYASGGKDYFDVLDTHNYLGSTTGGFQYPEGYLPGSPEGLFERVARIRKIMAQYHDEDKPMISTEFGYPDARQGSLLGAHIAASKAAFLVRGLIIQHVLGYRKVFVYSFFDEGDDMREPEQRYGMVDRYGQKKRAFFACKVLGEQLGNARYSAPIKGVDPGLGYGYVYRDRDQADRVVSVLWNGAKEMTGKFRTASPRITVVSMVGDTRELKVAEDGTFRAKYGFDPVYLVGNAPVELVEATEIPKPGDGKIELVPQRQVSYIGQGRNRIGCTVENRSGETAEVRVALENTAGKSLAETRVKLRKGEKRNITFPAPAQGERFLEKYILSMDYTNREESFSQFEPIYVRYLFPAPGVHSGKMYGYDTPVAVLVGRDFEVVIDPERGGRYLEFLDRRTGENQIRVPYDRLKELDQLPYYYCWDEISNAKGDYAVTRNHRYTLKTDRDSMLLTLAEPKELAVTKEIRRTGDNSFSLTVTMTNLGNEPAQYTWYFHPEYMLAGKAESFADDLVYFAKGAEQRLPYWSGLGGRSLPEWDKGEWRLEAKGRNYTIRQTFSLDEFRSPGIFFGPGHCNVEFRSRLKEPLKPGESWRGTMNWEFLTKAPAESAAAPER